MFLCPHTVALNVAGVVDRFSLHADDATLVLFCSGVTETGLPVCCSQYDQAKSPHTRDRCIAGLKQDLCGALYCESSLGSVAPRANSSLCNETGCTTNAQCQRFGVYYHIAEFDKACMVPGSCLWIYRLPRLIYNAQVSFPGGHIEAGEGAIEAALRETREEIGDSLGHVEVLGTCQTAPAGDDRPAVPMSIASSRELSHAQPSALATFTALDIGY